MQTTYIMHLVSEIINHMHYSKETGMFRIDGGFFIQYGPECWLEFRTKQELVDFVLAEFETHEQESSQEGKG